MSDDRVEKSDVDNVAEAGPSDVRPARPRASSAFAISLIGNFVTGTVMVLVGAQIEKPTEQSPIVLVPLFVATLTCVVCSILGIRQNTVGWIAGWLVALFLMPLVLAYTVLFSFGGKV